MMNEPNTRALARKRSIRQTLIAAPANADDLRSAFAAFEQVSARLSADYGQLETRVADLTEELRESRALRRHELDARERLAARLQNLLDALPAGVIVLDLEGRVQQTNPAALTLLSDMATGERWSDVVARNIAPQWDDGHDITLRNGRRVNISTQALSHEPGQIVLIKDVTETRQLQERLNLHKRLSANTEMAAALAHQLRTPIATALLSAAQLTRSTDPGTSACAYRVRDAMRHLERLIEDVLLFARGGELGASAIAASALIAGLRAAVGEMRLPEAFTITLDTDVPAVSLALNTDAVLSIMLNLVHNAVQACHGTGRIAVTAAIDGAALCITFADNGPGVDPVRAEQIFEPFVTTRAGGTGMGLAVARSVARAHGGELSLNLTQTPGACFELRLPVFDPDPRHCLDAGASGLSCGGQA